MFSLAVGLMLWTFVLVLALGMWLHTFWDVSLWRHMSLIQRVVWFVVAFVAPFFGVAAYWILKPKSIAR